MANVDRLSEAGVLPILISFAFPPVEADTTNAQFQSISGLRGLAINDKMRLEMVKGGCCEPLILAAGDECTKTMDVEVRREAAAAMFNLALSKENSIIMAQSGIVSALVSLMKLNDTVAQVFAVGTLSNLAEKGSAVQSRLLQDGCLPPLIGIIESSCAAVETKKEVARCLALFANVLESHEKLMHRESLECIMKLMTVEENVYCRRFAALAMANLALFPGNHKRLLSSRELLKGLRPLLSVEDAQTHQCVAFALHNICKNGHSHTDCEESEVASAISSILSLEDGFANLHGSLALRYYSVSKRGGAQFVECNGLPKLLQLANRGDLEQKLEAAACLRNLSLSDENKIRILREGGMALLADLSRSQDNQLAHQACGVLANLAEIPANQEEMVNEGILHHLKFVMRSTSDEVVREALRTLCNISSDFSCTELIANSGILVPLIRSLSSEEMLCRRFASMTISNLATNRDIQPRLVEEGAIQPLFFVSKGENDDKESRRHAFIALSNISASRGHHKVLLECGAIDLSLTFLEYSDEAFVLSAALCLSNLASNVQNHEVLRATGALEQMEPFLSHCERRLQLRAVSFVRGLSASSTMLDILVSPKMMKSLLKLATVGDVEIQMEILATLCNLSLSGNIGSDPHSFLENIQMSNLISFLCSADSTYRLFGAVVIGNIASDAKLQDAIVASGAISPLIHTADTADLESQRCIAYAICNLCAEPSNRAEVARQGGLMPVFSLGCANDNDDILAAMSTIRALASCTEIMHLLVESGGLEPIFAVCTMCDNQDCVQEASEALCWLSLHDENKESIVKHDKFEIIFGLAMSENSIVSARALRSLSNCSELDSLHRSILEKMSPVFLAGFAKSQLGTSSQELSRFVSNLCANHNSHENLFQMSLLSILFQLQEAGDPITTRNVVLSFLNLSTERSSHEELMKFGVELVGLLFQQCRLMAPDVDSVKSKRYACATVGGLLTSDAFHAMLLDHGVSDILSELLQGDDEEAVFTASFALHQLLKKNVGIQACKELDLEKIMIKMIVALNSDLAIHAVSSLRYLSLDTEMGSNIVSKDALPAIASIATQATNDMEREVAATLCHLSLCPGVKTAIANSAALDSILRLCESKDSECARFALGSLANCAEEPDSRLCLLTDGKVVQMLTKMMKNRILSLKREASRAMSNILSSDEAMDIFLAVSGLTSIDGLFRSLDCECQYSVALSLRKLASRITNHDLIIANGTLRAIFHLCTLEGNTRAVRQAATALRDLASNRAIKVLIADEGGITVAIALIRSTDASIRAISTGVLHHLSISSRLKYPLYDNGVLQQLCECILRSDDIDLLYHGANVLSNLAEHEKVKEFLWQELVVSALTAMANTSFKKVHSQVARCICFMSSALNANADKSLGTEAMKTAIALISSNSPHVAKDAVTAVGIFAKDLYGQVLVSALNAFPPIVNLVNREDEACRLYSCWALSRIMIPADNKILCIGNTNLISNLVELCSSRNVNQCLFVLMALCNISACKDTHSQILKSGGVAALLSLLLSSCDKTVSSSIKVLCNLSTSSVIRRQIVSENGVNTLLRLVDRDNMECKELAIMTLCNLIIGRDYGKVIAATGAIETFSCLLRDYKVTTMQQAGVLLLYNLSTNEDCQIYIASAPVLKSITNLCKSNDARCRQLAMMVLCNLAANDSTRMEATRNGGLQASILMLKDPNPGCRTHACICLGNLTNNANTQSQAVLHGGLSALTALLSDNDLILRRSAMACLVNVAANTSNHNDILSQSTVEAIYGLCNGGSSETEVYAACSFVNLVSNDDLLEIVGANGGVEVLMSLASSTNYHCQCAATTALRRLAETGENRTRLLRSGILRTMNDNSMVAEVDIRREVAACLLNLSQESAHRNDITDLCISSLLDLLSSEDSETIHSTAGTLANLAEEGDCRTTVIHHDTVTLLMPLLEHTCVNVYREVTRAISNLLSSCDIHDSFINSGLSSLLEICNDSDKECQYNVSLACRKIVINKKSHPTIMKHVANLLDLLKSDDVNTKKHVLTTLRDLSVNPSNRCSLVELNTVDVLVPFIDGDDSFIQTVAAATLRHLAADYSLKRRVLVDDIIVKAASSILGASDNLLAQLSGLIANLSEQDTNRSEMVAVGVVPALAVLSRAKQSDILQVSSCGQRY